jgi:protease-4
MGQTAASGGYWAAMNASHIMATPYTVTGSIGVIGSWFYDNGLNSKLGVNLDTIQRGAHADLLTGFFIPYRNLTAPEEERYKSYILDTYRIFIEKVAAGRGMETEKVEAVAQGRILSGTRALEAGLIDSIGSLSDALRLAQKLAGIPEDKAVLYRKYPEPGFFEKLVNRFPAAKILFKNKNSQTNTASLFAELFLSDDVRYRLEKNGQVMPILPLEFSLLHK